MTKKNPKCDICGFETNGEMLCSPECEEQYMENQARRDNGDYE